MNQKRRQGGISIPEVLVSGFCLLLLLGLIAPLLGRTHRVIQRADQDASAQQQALTAMQRLFSEAAYADGRTLCFLENDRTIVSFLSLQTPRSGNPPGLAVTDFESLAIINPHVSWHKTVCIYWDAAQRLLYAKEFAYSGSELVRVHKNRLQDLAYRNDAVSRPLARGIVEFEARCPREGQLKVSLTAEQKFDRVVRSHLEYVLTMRN